MTKYFKIILLTIISIIFISFAYLHKYQQIVYEGTALAEERCQKVVPVIQKKNQKFWESSEIIYGSNDPQKIADAIDDLLPYIEKTKTISKQWLDKDKLFLNRWDYKFFTHDKLEEVFAAQYDKFELDYLNNEIMYLYMQNPSDKELEKSALNMMKKQENAQKVFNEKQVQASKETDFRTSFIDIPDLKCPEL